MSLPVLNQLSAARAAGQVPLGHMIVEFPTPRTASMLADCGLDFVILDMEHTAHSIETIAASLTGFAGSTISAFVRVPVAEYHFIARMLDAGAAGVMVPDVQNAEQARQIVAAAKYEPRGRRGVFLGGALTQYRAVEAGAYLAAANASTGIICQIESVAGLNHVEEIAGVPGVDVLWVGHNDLTRSLGIPGKFDHPEFTAAFQKVAAAARRHGCGVGAQPRDAAQAATFMALGADVLSCSADVFVYRDALRAGIAALRALSPP
jgi:2-keto-3-deoxy-L-rhamnonate aldolase RhmA